MENSQLNKLISIMLIAISIYGCKKEPCKTKIVKIAEVGACLYWRCGVKYEDGTFKEIGIYPDFPLPIKGRVIEVCENEE